MVRALASHQCVSGSIPGPGVICGLSLLLVPRPCSEGFSPCSPVFLPPQKPTFLTSNSIGNSRATGLSVEELFVSLSLNKVNFYWFVCLFAIYITAIRTNATRLAKKFAPLFHPIRSKPKPLVTFSQTFSRAFLRVIISSCYRFTV